MNNFTSMILAVLEKLELLTHDEATELVKEIHSATLPDNYEQCVKVVENIFQKVKVESVHTKIAPTIKSAISPLLEPTKVVTANNKLTP